MNPTWLFVAAVFSIATLLIRRGGGDLPWRIAGLFYALTLMFFWSSMTGPYVTFPADFIRLMPPWAGMAKHVVTYGNEGLNDLTMQIVPWAHQVRESWRTFHIPLWNAKTGSGYPLLANGQSSAFSIIRLISLPLSLAHSMTAEAAFKVLIALTFTWLYCRRRGWSELASSIGATSFGFCTFMTVWLHFPLTTVGCFVPMILYAVEQIVDEIAHEGVRYRTFVLSTLAWVAVLFGGHPETAAHIFIFALLYVLWIVLGERPFSWRHSLRLLLVLGAAMVVAAIIASPFIAPFSEAITKSKRFHELRAHPAESGSFSDLWSAITIFQPHFFGDVPLEQEWGPEHPENISGFGGILGTAGWMALLFASVRRRGWRSREFFFVLVSPLLIGTVLDWPLVSALARFVFRFAANGRLRLLIAFATAIQGAALVDLIERERRLQPVLGLLVVSLGFAWLMEPSHFDIEWHIWNSTLSVLPSIIVVALAALSAIAARRWRFLLLSALMVAVVAEMWCTGIDWNLPVHEHQIYPSTPAIRRMQQLRASAPPNMPFRFAGIGPTFFPNANAVYGLEDVRVHDPMANARYMGLISYVTKDYRPTDYFTKWMDPDTTMLDFLGARYIITPPHAKLDPDHYSVLYDEKDATLFENRRWMPRFFPVGTIVLEFKGDKFVKRLLEEPDFTRVAILKKLPVENDQNRRDLLAARPTNAPLATVRITSASDSDYRLHVEAPRYTLVASSIPYWPGWKATANGRRLEPLQIDNTFLGFVVRPGASDVRVWFSPPTFWISVWASLLTILLLATYPIVPSPRAKRGEGARRADEGSC